MKVIVLGGTGHIGTYLIPMLVDFGYDVVSITRGSSQPYEYNPSWEKAISIQMNRQDTIDFSSKIATMEPDIVVDLISFTLEDTKQMVNALQKSGCIHYLFCSSCWAHGRAEILPSNPDDFKKEPLDEYGKQKFASEMYLKELYLKEGFPSTIIMPGQISGPGWTIMNPWANKTPIPFQKIANGDEILLPNFGMETLHQIIQIQKKEIEQLVEYIPDDKLRELNLEKYIRNDFSYNHDFELEL